MSWNLAFDLSSEFWEETIPDLSKIFLSTSSAPPVPVPDLSLNADALFKEPRSIHSSELSDSSSEANEPLQWTAEEDPLLKGEVPKNAPEVPTVAQSSLEGNSVSVKKRSGSNKKNRHWTEEDDKLILGLYKKYGGNWKKIAESFENVNSSMVKNHFYSKLRFKVKNQGPEKLNNEAEKDVKIKSIEELTAEEKRLKLKILYEEMNQIENYLQKAKSQIQDFVKKFKAPPNNN